MKQILTSFEDLKSQALQCRICEPHLPMGANPVFRAHPSSRILISAQAPGVRVHNSSIPFNDPSGDRLRQWMGVDTETFYDTRMISIIPMGFCYPGTGKSGDLPPRPECSKHWHKPLLAYLESIELKIIIGQYAHQFHLAESRSKTLTETVRNWRTFMPHTIPLPHPSPRNNIWLRKNPWFESDVVPGLQARIREILHKS
ncbi:MAG: uracil-DNA glycosylase family protein [Pseudomonadota bacterium]